jgi:hypothetical protein
MLWNVVRNRRPAKTHEGAAHYFCVALKKGRGRASQIFVDNPLRGAPEIKKNKTEPKKEKKSCFSQKKLESVRRAVKAIGGRG